MSKIIDTQKHTITVTCPDCINRFECKVEVDIFEPTIEIDVN